MKLFQAGVDTRSSLCHICINREIFERYDHGRPPGAPNIFTEIEAYIKKQFHIYDYIGWDYGDDYEFGPYIYFNTDITMSEIVDHLNSVQDQWVKYQVPSLERMIRDKLHSNVYMALSLCHYQKNVGFKTAIAFISNHLR